MDIFNIRSNYSKKKLPAAGKIFFWLLLGAFPLIASANHAGLVLPEESRAGIAQQEHVIRGIVTDEAGEPLPGVTVAVKGGATGVATDLNGGFSLRASSLPVSIIISFIGFRPQEVDVYDASESIAVTLIENRNMLDEIVITGYTSQKRKSISAAITTVNFGEDIVSQADNNFSQILQGKAAGMQVTAASGIPGGGVTVLIRGNNSITGSVEPLYVVDGVFIRNAAPVSMNGGSPVSSALADINPADIESISILKDANATAIYGSQGANGVVVVTTKRGKANTRSRINLTASHGWSTAPKKFKAASGPESQRIFNEAAINRAMDEGKDPNSITLPYPDWQNAPTYDRISDIFQTAQTSDYQLSIQGGDAKSAHYIGIGYTAEESIVVPPEFTRFSTRFNYDNNVTNKLKVGTSFSISHSQRERVRNSDNDPRGLVNSVIFPHSWDPVYNADGSYANTGTFENHKRLMEHLDNKYVTWRGIINLFGEYSFLPELKLRSSWSADYVHNTSRTFSDFALSATGSSSVGSSLNLVYTVEHLLTWNQSFGRDKQHAFNALLGNTVDIRPAGSVTANGSSYLFDQLKEVSSGATTTGSSSTSESRLLSFFGRFGYSYIDKYSIDFNLRADGSSRFGKDKRWGYFPSVGVSWNAGQESFVRNTGVFDALKVRGSFGYSGNQNGIGNYASLGLWSSSNGYLDQGVLSPNQLANPELTWEMSRQTDLGVEFSILKNRVTVDLDVYRKYTYDMLLDVNVPSRSGYTTSTQNYGELENRGVEFNLETVNLKTRNFSWRTNFNISANRNKIIKIPQEQTLAASGRGVSILRQGEAIGSFFLYKQLYVDSQTGNAVYDDLDKSGDITYADRQIVGRGTPDYTGGFTNTATYRNLELSIFFYFSKGNDIMNMQDFFLVHGGTMTGLGFNPRQLKRWQRPGDITDIPRVTTYSGNPNLNGDQPGSGANNYTGTVSNLSSRYLEDGSFLRLKNVALSYNIPKSISSKLSLERIRATVSATNLWTLTGYNGLDPEVNAQIDTSQNAPGYDWAAIPQPRTIQFTLNITL